jgi:hypothetical protein
MSDSKTGSTSTRRDVERRGMIVSELHQGRRVFFVGFAESNRMVSRYFECVDDFIVLFSRV